MKTYKKVLIGFVVAATLALLGIFMFVSLLSSSLISGEYRQYTSFEKWHNKSMSKQKVLDKLGYPDYYIIGNDNYSILPLEDKQTVHKPSLLQSGCECWKYTCNKYGDSDPYYLEIKFDENGKLQSAQMHVVKGG